MEVLLIGTESDAAEAVVGRLTAQGDQVGVIVEDGERAARWKELGAHVATGSADDVDLIFRAATHARTIVVLRPARADVSAVMDAVVEGAHMLADPPRVVFCAPDPQPGEVGVLRDSGLDYISLGTGRRRALPILGGAALSADDVARVVDAADDVAGEARHELDMTRAEDWDVLRLPPPSDG